MVGIHNYEQDFKRHLERIEEDKSILKANKSWAYKFKDRLLSEGIGLCKINRYLYDVEKCSKILGKPFEKASKEDIRRVVSAINQEQLSEETKRGFKIMLRKLYRMIKGIDEKGVYPDEVKWVSIGLGVKHNKLPEELLNEEEVKAIIGACSNTRDKAFIACLAESGCRISEIGTLKIKHISFEQYGVRLMVNGKTGMRKILIVNSMPYLQEWLNNHPNNKEPNAFLWHSQKESLLRYARLTLILKRAAIKAGIRKRVYPHLLRHSRATQLANIMSDSQLKNYLGWTQGSKMAGIYVHLSGKDTDEAVLKANHITLEQEIKAPALQPVQCARCKGANPATHRFCNRCGFTLNGESANEVLKQDTEQKNATDVIGMLLKDPEVRELLMKKMKEAIG